MRLDPIVIVDADPSWAGSFERERARVASALDGWLVRPVEHMGSTAVPGLPAKPIIDMLAVVDDIDGDDPVGRLARIDWVHAPEPFDQAERKLSFCFPDIGHRSHHLHVVEESSDGWRGWLAFRDHLRAHPDVAREYADLKSQLADAHGADPNARDAYRFGKAEFVQRITTLALDDASDAS